MNTELTLKEKIELAIDANGKLGLNNPILKDILKDLEKIPYIPFPVSLSTVDIIPLYKGENGFDYVLLGRKHNRKDFQFIGGFRDPKEMNERAAARELKEESGLDLSPTRFKHLGSLFIDDNRYRDSCHKITTTIFAIDLTWEEYQKSVGGDDIEEVKLFEINGLKIDNSIIRPVHQLMFDLIFNG